MKKTLFWGTVALAAVGAFVSLLPDMKRYIKMERM
jgi:hypothetical protein